MAPWTTAQRAPLSSTVSWSLLRFVFIESVTPSNHRILCCPLLLSLVFPSIRVFSSKSALHITWPEHWSFSFSISLCNEYSGWFPLGLTVLLSLQFKGLWRVFSSTTIWKHQFFSAQPSLWSSSHICTCYWKNHSFDYVDLCWQSDFSAF